MKTLRVFIATPDRLATVLGLCLLGVGCAAVWLPLGPIVAGAALLIVANLPWGA